MDGGDGNDPELRDENIRNDQTHAYFRLPHKNGVGVNCGDPLSKWFLQYFENGMLVSGFEEAMEALRKVGECTYWIGARGIKERLFEY